MQTALRPIEDRIVILPDPLPTETDFGIALPDNLKRDSMGIRWGHVLAVGPGAYSEKTGKRIAHGIEVGDHVAFGEYAGAAVYPRGEPELFVLRAEEVVALERDQSSAD